MDFLSKKLEPFSDYTDSEDNYQKTKESLGLEPIDREKKTMFYLVKCQVLGGLSLLEYIDSHNVRLTRQREELIDVSVTIANLNKRGVDKEALEEVINHYKSGLPSGEGLRDMIVQIKERYPWTSSKEVIMIFLSLMTCLLGIGLYVFDLTTDLQFSVEIFHKTSQHEYSNESADFGIFLSENGDKVPSCKSYSEECCQDLNDTFERRHILTSPVNWENEDYRYRITGLIAGWHCIQPFFASIIVFIIMECRKGGKFSAPDVPEHFKKKRWWCLNSVLFFLPILTFTGSVLPIPALTYLYRFYLDVRCHNARSHPDFRTRIIKYERMIRKHESLGKLSNYFLSIKSAVSLELCNFIHMINY